MSRRPPMAPRSKARRRRSRAPSPSPWIPRRSSLELRDAAGTSLAEGGVDPADDLRMAIDPVPELAPGTYAVQWQAVAVDGHIERDTWTFTVVAPTPTPDAHADPGAIRHRRAVRHTARLRARRRVRPRRPPRPRPLTRATAPATASDVILPIIARAGHRGRSSRWRSSVARARRPANDRGAATTPHPTSRGRPRA